MTVMGLLAHCNKSGSTQTLEHINKKTCSWGQWGLLAVLPQMNGGSSERAKFESSIKNSNFSC